MVYFPDNLQQKLEKRKNEYAFRALTKKNGNIDFYSNDYLGFSGDEKLFQKGHQFLIENNIVQNGSTGSRLISGNFPLMEEVEHFLAAFHDTEDALIFNSGYDANVGFFSAVPQRGDYVLFDEYIHASIRDGIQLSYANSQKFKHNDDEDMENRIVKIREKDPNTNLYVVTESVFSMDGDSPDFQKLVALIEKYKLLMVVDEAHALGVFGQNGAGLIQELNVQNKIFARIVTFGKGLGCHGAAILGSRLLKNYLVNFARSFIYTTAPTPHNIASVYIGYQELLGTQNIKTLHHRINFFKEKITQYNLDGKIIESQSPIQSIVIPDNERVKKISAFIQNKGFSVKAILSPTVPAGKERLRICLHSFNSEKEIEDLFLCLKEIFSEV